MKGWRRPAFLAGVAAGALCAVSCSRVPEERDGRAGPAGAVEVLSFRVVKAYPHDPSAFTQGLAFHEGVLYESTGLHGRSSLRKVDLETGKVLELRPLPERYFGEGMAVVGDRVIQLTWLSRTGLIYDLDGLSVTGKFDYAGQGWGLAWDGGRLVMSDGTAQLRFLDPESLEETGRLTVRDGKSPVARLNELEFVRGKLYANVWRTDRVAVIDSVSGKVSAWIDLAGLLENRDRGGPVGVLNGIAYDAPNDRLFVTGKLWPKLFEIEVRAPE